jgi:hypothetical protein
MIRPVIIDVVLHVCNPNDCGGIATIKPCSMLGIMSWKREPLVNIHSQNVDIVSRGRRLPSAVRKQCQPAI